MPRLQPTVSNGCHESIKALAQLKGLSPDRAAALILESWHSNPTWRRQMGIAQSPAVLETLRLAIAQQVQLDPSNMDLAELLNAIEQVSETISKNKAPDENDGG